MRPYRGESELEFYGLLSPDDGPEFSYCEGCGEPTNDVIETGDMVLLCPTCYDLCESEEE